MSSVYEVRSFQTGDAEEVSALIVRTLRTVNSKDYPEKVIEANVLSHSPDVMIEQATNGHMYVVCDGARIVGCGAVAGYLGSVDESILLSFFVLPEYQGKGIGRMIMQTLEQDEYFLRAKRIEIHASITAVDFYRKMGYESKKLIEVSDDEPIYIMEKNREIQRRGEAPCQN